MLLSNFLGTILSSFIFTQALRKDGKQIVNRKRTFLVHAVSIVYFLTNLVLNTTQSTLLSITIPLFVIYLPMWIAKLPTSNLVDRAELLLVTVFTAVLCTLSLEIQSPSTIGFIEACLLLAQMMVSYVPMRKKK